MSRTPEEILAMQRRTIEEQDRAHPIWDVTGGGERFTVTAASDEAAKIAAYNLLMSFYASEEKQYKYTKPSSFVARRVW